MSYGALKLKSGEYQSLGGEVITPTDFEEQKYIANPKLLIDKFGLPESAIAELNGIIGRFLVLIQNVSFVHRQILEVVPPARSSWEKPIDEPTPTAYGSTLAVYTLLKTIRENSENLIRNVLALIPESGVEKNGENSDEETIQGGSLTFSNRQIHEHEIDYTLLLTDEACALIAKHCGEDYVLHIRTILQNFAAGILRRADLSFNSISSDKTVLAQKTKGIEHFEGAPYSTLNPVDLMMTAKKELEFVPIKLAIVQHVLSQSKEPSSQL